MKIKQNICINVSSVWGILSSFLAGVGLFFVGLISSAKAQPYWPDDNHRIMARGLIAHSIFNAGMSGLKDPSTNIPYTSFAYPQGRHLKIYSGGSARVGWGTRQNSAGEGIWILSNTNSTPHVTAVGGLSVSQDVERIPQNPSTYPEAYLGVVEDENWALAYRLKDGNEQIQARGVPQHRAQTNYWPSQGGIAAAETPINANTPAVIWNYRYGRYNSGQSFTDRIAKGDFQQRNTPNGSEGLSEDDFPELIGISKARSKNTGLQWTRKWYQWGHADYDDFLINETVVENTSNAPVHNIYIVMRNRFWQQSANAWRNDNAMSTTPRDWARDDHARSTVAANYLQGVSRDAFLTGAGKPAGLQLGKTLADQGHAMIYYHDGESDHFTNSHFDVGDPYRYVFAKDRFVKDQSWIPENFMQHTQYFGMGVIDVFPPFNTYGGQDSDVYVTPHDNPDTPLNESQTQPASVTMWKYFNPTDFDNPDPTVDPASFIYDQLTSAGYHDEPDDPSAYVHLVAFGPYHLAPNEKAKIVLAYAGGMGANAPQFDNYKRYAQPFNFGWINLYGGTNQANVTFNTRQREIPLGEDAMFRHFQRAIDVYNWGYDIPNQPPNVKLSWTSDRNANNKLSWSAFGEDATDPDYTGSEAKDLRGYRIYRSTVQNVGPWEFVAEFSFEDARQGMLPKGITYDPNDIFHTNKSSAHPTGIPLRENQFLSGTDPDAGATIPGLYTFSDTRSLAGFGVHYAVRLYDSGHSNWKGTGQSIPVQESAPGPAGGAIIGDRNGLIPQIPGIAEFDRLEAQVRMVPNPWKADDDLHTYNRSQNIRFINLPGRCQIDLYDITGQRIWTFFNNNTGTGEVTWQQFTENRPSNFGSSMASGMYFWKVTSYMPGSEGKTQTGTFLIIK